MINQETLTRMTPLVNSIICPSCGMKHRVHLSLSSDHAFAKSSTDWLISPSGERVCMEIENGECKGLRERVARLIVAEIF